MGVIRGAHKPRVTLHGCLSVTQVFEGEESDRQAQFSGHGVGREGAICK